MSRLVSLFAAFVLAIPLLHAQSIRYDSARKIFLITTPHSSYAMGVSPDGQLQHLYWGAPLTRIEDLPPARAAHGMSSFDSSEMLENEEYPGWGGPRYYEPAVKVTRADGDRDLVLHYTAHKINGNELTVTLRDINDAIETALHYQIDSATGIVKRWSVVSNHTKQALTIESAQSAAWYVPHGDGYRLSYLSGRWIAEMQLNREPIHEGLKVLESRLGHTGHNFNPWFAIDAGDADEAHGRVWFGAIAWSGNWRLTIEQTPYKQVRVTGGLNTFDFSWKLSPGESFETPAFYGGFSSTGFGNASRLLHNLERTSIAPHGVEARLRPVLYNSWEATTFDVNEPGQKALAEKAAKLGVELFVIDDGWFGKRNDDHAGLGDWFVNRTKFPNDLQPLIAYVNKLGMDFGIWVEPEMVNPDSDLYRAHPDWVMNFPGRPRSELRNQLVLNLARDDVREYIFNALDRLATQYNIRYFKWDMNRVFAEPGWPEMPPDQQKELWTRYTWNLYNILDRLRVKHPNLEIESCSGGGGRIDLGELRYVDEFWTSDNTEAFDRLRIQEGFSQAYAAHYMSAWVTDVPNTNGRSTSLSYRFLVAMQGALGIGANLTKWSDDEAALATRMVANYKSIRETVQNGDLYRLLSPRDNDTSANEYVSKDGKQAVLFAFRHSQQYNTESPLIYFQGLDPRALYHVESIDNKLQDGPHDWTGAWLMQHGLQVVLKSDFDGTQLTVRKLD